MFNLFDVECTKKEVLKKALTHPSPKNSSRS